MLLYAARKQNQLTSMASSSAKMCLLKNAIQLQEKFQRHANLLHIAGRERATTPTRGRALTTPRKLRVSGMGAHGLNSRQRNASSDAAFLATKQHLFRLCDANAFQACLGLKQITSRALQTKCNAFLKCKIRNAAPASIRVNLRKHAR